jgi:hypothetical protein
MQIEYVQDGPYAEVSFEDSVLRVAGISIDLDARQADAQVIIDITKRDGQIAEGISGQDGSYVASVILPPKEYEEIETGETEEDGSPKIERRALPLDVNKAVLKLWQLPADQIDSEITEEE